MKKLTCLDLGATEITSRGLAKLAELPRLDNLIIEDTHISDDDLAVLEAFPSLRQVWVLGTDVTPEGIQRAKDRMPHCTIRVD